MGINVEKVNDVLNNLAKKLISRESAHVWSTEARDAYDNGKTELYPMSSEDKILDALEFIELFAEKINPETYLYSDSDLKEYMEKNGWKLDKD